MVPRRGNNKVDQLLKTYANEDYFDQGFSEFEDSTCCICLEEIWGTADGPKPAKKPMLTKIKRCGHIFHSKCIRSWL